jgi:hypothetical protein
METAISLHRGPDGKPGGGTHLLGTLKDGQRRAQEMEHFYGSSAGNLRGGSFTMDLDGYV